MHISCSDDRPPIVTFARASVLYVHLTITLSPICSCGYGARSRVVSCSQGKEQRKARKNASVQRSPCRSLAPDAPVIQTPREHSRHNTQQQSSHTDTDTETKTDYLCLRQTLSARARTTTDLEVEVVVRLRILLHSDAVSHNVHCDRAPCVRCNNSQRLVIHKPQYKPHHKAQSIHSMSPSTHQLCACAAATRTRSPTRSGTSHSCTVLDTCV